MRVQVPAPTMVTVEPETVHTDKVVDVMLTARPEDAEALTVKGATPKVTLLNGPKGPWLTPLVTFVCQMRAVAPAAVLWKTTIGAVWYRPATIVSFAWRLSVGFTPPTVN